MLTINRQRPSQRRAPRARLNTVYQEASLAERQSSRTKLVREFKMLVGADDQEAAHDKNAPMRQKRSRTELAALAEEVLLEAELKKRTE